MRTPLYDEHVALGGRMVEFAGWELPVLYRGIILEHEHTRRACSIFDTCHMGKFELTGPAAAADLDRLLTQGIRDLAPGRGAYGYMLAEDGGVLDDTICFRLGPDRFWLVVNAGTSKSDESWIRAHLSVGTSMTDLSALFGKMDVQGPRARSAVEAAFGVKLPDLRYFGICDIELRGVHCVMSRTGYTGEFGYELFIPIEAAVEFWRALLAAGTVAPAGLGARDTLRLEMGYPLYGHELSRERGPLGGGGVRFIAAGKDYVGRAAVEQEAVLGPKQVLVGLRLERRIAARTGDAVLARGAEIGTVSSGAFAPSVGVAVAMAYVAREYAIPGAALSVRVRDKELPARVAALPFYSAGTCRDKNI